MLPVAASSVCSDQVSISAFDPPRFAPAGHGASHGIAAGSVLTESADARSLGIHMLTLCSDLALLTRPVVLSLCLSTTVIDIASAVTSNAVRVTLMSTS